MVGPQSKAWYAACKLEYKIQVTQVTQSIFTIIILSSNHKAIKKKCIFKLKKNLDKSIRRFKTR